MRSQSQQGGARGFGRRHRNKLVIAGLLLLTPVAAHVAIVHLTSITPPTVAPNAIAAISAISAKTGQGGVRFAGNGWTTLYGLRGGPGVRVVSLAGTPEEIGTQHAVLVRQYMIANEKVLWEGFEQLVPIWPLRTLMLDVGRFRYRHVASGFPEPRQRELAAGALAFSPDPYSAHMATYSRMVLLHALYDIALSFEHSPLLGTGASTLSRPIRAAHDTPAGPELDGCSAFGLGPTRTASGHPLFARAFDFEAADVFDRDKAVFVVRENGLIPFASVAWPGLVGVFTGMNAEGVAVAVNGARAREPMTTGMPVVFSLREVLSKARDTKEAVAILSAQSVMVSHLVFVGDQNGNFAIVERAPGEKAFVRKSADPARVAVTNHFEGPLATDPSNIRVMQTTTSLARRARIDELLGQVEPKTATVAHAVHMLRDHACAGGVACQIGDRRSIDALIATHGVVFDLAEKTLWVSEGPHLSGRFVKIALGPIVSSTGGPPIANEDAIGPDEVLGDSRYAEGRARAGGPLFGREEPWPPKISGDQAQ
ncbi:MAG: C45 family peptidase [Polyangiaceae bacterium]|nr:C45 family peptidase [Polyangiaceae bacterium]